LPVETETVAVDRLNRRRLLEPLWPDEREWCELCTVGTVLEFLRWEDELPSSETEQRLARYEAEAKEFVQARERIWQAP
jgi:hypothetical protein